MGAGGTRPQAPSPEQLRSQREVPIPPHKGVTQNDVSVPGMGQSQPIRGDRPGHFPPQPLLQAGRLRIRLAQQGGRDGMDSDTADYDTLLDPEMRAFVAKVDALYDPATAFAPLGDQRAAYDRLCAAFDFPHPAGVVATDVTLGGRPCRRYVPWDAHPGVTVLYAHGGGYVVGSLASHDAICAELAALSGLRLVAVDYRLAPEHLHPAQIEDVLAALDALLAGGDSVVLAGDSAGGTLAALAAAARKGPRLAGQVLIYPALGAGMDTASMQLHANAPGLTRGDMKFYEGVRFARGVKGGADAWPLLAADFDGLPPTVLFPAECDPLADDAELYAARLRAAGVPAEVITGRGLVHGHLRARHMSSAAGAHFRTIAGALARLAKGGDSV